MPGIFRDCGLLEGFQRDVCGYLTRENNLREYIVARFRLVSSLRFSNTVYIYFGVCFSFRDIPAKTTDGSSFAKGPSGTRTKVPLGFLQIRINCNRNNIGICFFLLFLLGIKKKLNIEYS